MHELELSAFEVFDVFEARHIPTYVVVSSGRVTRDKGRDFSRAACVEMSSCPPPPLPYSGQRWPMTRNLPDTCPKGTKGKIGGDKERESGSRESGTYEVRGSDTLAACDRRIRGNKGRYALVGARYGTLLKLVFDSGLETAGVTRVTGKNLIDLYRAAFSRTIALSENPRGIIRGWEWRKVSSSVRCFALARLPSGGRDASRQHANIELGIIQTRQPHLRRVAPYCATRSWDRYAWTLMGRRISWSLTRTHWQVGVGCRGIDAGKEGGGTLKG